MSARDLRRPPPRPRVAAPRRPRRAAPRSCSAPSAGTTSAPRPGTPRPPASSSSSSTCAPGAPAGRGVRRGRPSCRRGARGGAELAQPPRARQRPGGRRRCQGGPRAHPLHGRLRRARRVPAAGALRTTSWLLATACPAPRCSKLFVKTMRGEAPLSTPPFQAHTASAPSVQSIPPAYCFLHASPQLCFSCRCRR
jgi:hypothetical protein